MKVRVEALKESQEGRDDPLDKVAVYVRLSLSTSKGVGWNLVTKGSVFCCCFIAIALATVGASLVLVTMRLKVSETEALDPSVAVTLTPMVPTSELVGVPVKVRVEAWEARRAG